MVNLSPSRFYRRGLEKSNVQVLTQNRGSMETMRPQLLHIMTLTLQNIIITEPAAKLIWMQDSHLSGMWTVVVKVLRKNLSPLVRIIYEILIKVQAQLKSQDKEACKSLAQIVSVSARSRLPYVATCHRNQTTTSIKCMPLKVKDGILLTKPINLIIVSRSQLCLKIHNFREAILLRLVVAWEKCRFSMCRILKQCQLTIRDQDLVTMKSTKVLVKGPGYPSLRMHLAGV